MAITREFDNEKRMMKLAFKNGQTFGPVEFNPITDVLTRLIGELEDRVAALEGNAK